MSSRDSKDQKLNELLVALGDDSLSRSHNSINISFSQMLAYIDEIRMPREAPEEALPEELRLLLQTYRDMAQKFYVQYEVSLLEEIEKKRILQAQVGGIISRLEADAGPGADLANRKAAAVVTDFLRRNADAAGGEHAELTGNYSTHMQAALDKLRDEWQRLQTILTASLALNKDKQLFRALDAVVDAAAISVGMTNAGRIMIVPGSSFSLYFFSYLENFAVLTVPIYSMRAPWEWSIFWHELAGYQVRQLGKYAVIADLRDKLRDFHRRYQALDAPQREALLDKVTRNEMYDRWNTPKQDAAVKENLGKRRNQFSLEYLKKVFSGKELTPKNLEDLGGLDLQFERILEELNIPRKDRLRRYEEIRKAGWCADWIKELFEDAWSVLSIRAPFLDFFQDILNRHKSSDGRHPEPAVRLRVAGEILRLLDPDFIPRNPADELESAAARQILALISLLIAASYQFDEEDDLNLTVQRVLRNSLPEMVGTLIGQSIKRWSGEFIEAKGRVLQAEDDAETVIEALSNDELNKFLTNLDLQDGNENNLPKAAYEDLLEGRDYKSLLDLPFFDRDFLNSNKIKGVQFGAGVNANSPFFNVEATVNFILPANVLLPGRGGDISFEIDGQAFHTTKINWNEAFKLHPQYRLM